MAENSKPKIVVVGSSNTDMIVQVPRIPKPGETMLGGRFTTAAGGKGANQAVAAAKSGGDVSFVARLGHDSLGERALAGLRSHAIDVEHIFIDDDAASGVALISVAEDGENSIAVASGANARLSVFDIEDSEEVIVNADILLIQLEVPIETVAKAAELASLHDVPVVLNPAPAQPLPDSLLKCVTVLTPNESEAGLLTGISVKNTGSAKKALAKLLAKGVNTVIVTRGSKGAVLGTAQDVQVVPAYKVQTVDTTAAGDVFNGALAVALSLKKSVRSAVEFASAAAALSVTKLGAQPSIPSKEEIQMFIAGKPLV